MGRGKPTLSLEEYEGFLHNPNDVDLSNIQMNQIIFMHGFKKIHKQRKNVVLELIQEINLTKPYRSTLHENDINSNRPDGSLISLQEVKDDVAILNWQECQVHSIVSVGLSEEGSNDCEDLLSATTSFNGTGRRSKRKRRTVWMTCQGSEGDIRSYMDTYDWES